jgi:electron transfer flavoprotein alpha subunit
VIAVRDGVAPLGADEAVAESDGAAVIVGSGTRQAAAELAPFARSIDCVEIGQYAPATWAASLVELLGASDIVVLPGSPDGRDLAPHLAAGLGRPLHCGATELHAEHVTVSRRGGMVLEDITIDGPCVVTLQPGVRGAAPVTMPVAVTDRTVHVVSRPDTEVLGVLPPDAATMDLAESKRIVAGGAGLDGAPRFEQLREVSAALGASLGATRVITDRGWIDHERQIGTTGVVVAPKLYLAFAISGAVQHTSGLGNPDHIISVNTDPHCPMMRLADLAITANANEVIAALAEQLGVSGA